MLSTLHKCLQAEMYRSIISFYFLLIKFSQIEISFSSLDVSQLPENYVSSSIGGSVVECSPATRAARVRFPADASNVLGLLSPLKSHAASRKKSVTFRLETSNTHEFHDCLRDYDEKT